MIGYYGFNIKKAICRKQMTFKKGYVFLFYAFSNFNKLIICSANSVPILS
jgi:hypothetical protein